MWESGGAARNQTQIREIATAKCKANRGPKNQKVNLGLVDPRSYVKGRDEDIFVRGGTQRAVTI